MNIDGSTVRTMTIEMIAPLASSIHNEEIMPISDVNATPIVAAKNPSAETMTDFMEVRSAMPTSPMARVLAFPTEPNLPKP